MSNEPEKPTLEQIRRQRMDEWFNSLTPDQQQCVEDQRQRARELGMSEDTIMNTIYAKRYPPMMSDFFPEGIDPAAIVHPRKEYSTKRKKKRG